MKTLVLNEDTARTLYPTSSKEFKIILEETFGKKFFSLKLTDTVKTLDDVYTRLNRLKPILSDYYFLPEEKQERALNTQYIDDIAELFNEGWKPDFKDKNQYKYYNWFERKSSGWVFDFYYCRSDYSSVGSGFYFKNSELATYCGNQFLDIYSKVLE